ncbi:MAG: lyase family protein [Bacteroidales bacterium]
MPVARSENLPDTTQNLDAFVEVHGILKAHAVNLEKIAGDLRLLSADTMGAGQIHIPRRQTGSSIMPGKVNPVIPEYIISAAHKVYSNDTLITSLCGQASLDLNAYLPMIGHALIDSLKLLVNAATSMQKNLTEGLQTEKDDSLQQIMHSPSVTTALIPYIGYRKAADLARHMKEHQCSIKEANHVLQVLSPGKLEQLLKPEKLLQLGYSLRDLSSPWQ